MTSFLGHVHFNTHAKTKFMHNDFLPIMKTGRNVGFKDILTSENPEKQFIDFKIKHFII